jgi:hypothetical protein
MAIHARANSRVLHYDPLFPDPPPSPPPTPHPHPLAPKPNRSMSAALADAARAALAPRKPRQRSTLLVILALLACSAYLFIAYPALANAPHALRHPAAAAKAHWTAHRKQSTPKKLAAQLTLDAQQELAAVTAFLASLPQNVIPGSVDPLAPIDPQLVLDFDTRSPHAAEEVEAMVEDVWIRNPVVLYAKYYSPVTREIKAILDKLNLRPAPTIFDVDQRDDAAVLVPLLARLVNTTDLPVLLVGGVPLMPPASNVRPDPAAPVLPPSTLEYIRELHSTGELTALFKSAGASVGGKRKKGRRS